MDMLPSTSSTQFRTVVGMSIMFCWIYISDSFDIPPHYAMPVQIGVSKISRPESIPGSLSLWLRKYDHISGFSRRYVHNRRYSFSYV